MLDKVDFTDQKGRLFVSLLTGNLTADPELRYTPSGKTVVSASIANNEHYTDAQGQDSRRFDPIDRDKLVDEFRIEPMVFIIRRDD